jgi:hypothetical protein
MTFIERKPGRTWRGSPLFEGQAYRVLVVAPSYPHGDFSPGEVLKYYGASYSHYDNMSVYVFTNADGQERTWVLFDDQPLESWSSVFAPVANAG